MDEPKIQLEETKDVEQRNLPVHARPLSSPRISVAGPRVTTSERGSSPPRRGGPPTSERRVHPARGCDMIGGAERKTLSLPIPRRWRSTSSSSASCPPVWSRLPENRTVEGASSHDPRRPTTTRRPHSEALLACPGRRQARRVGATLTALLQEERGQEEVQGDDHAGGSVRLESLFARSTSRTRTTASRIAASFLAKTTLSIMSGGRDGAASSELPDRSKVEVPEDRGIGRERNPNPRTIGPFATHG
jgi:hypothetical protein